jgi:hypothetical protein
MSGGPQMKKLSGPLRGLGGSPPITPPLKRRGSLRSVMAKAMTYQFSFVRWRGLGLIPAILGGE